MKVRLSWVPLFGQLALVPLQGASASLQFQGNQNFDDTLLSERLSQKGLDIDQVSSWTTGQKDRAQRLVRIFYQDRGYPLSSVTLEGTADDCKLAILEGPRTKLSQVNFEGNTSFPDTQLEKFFQLGDWFSQGEVTESLEEIKEFYENEGYIRAEVREGQLKIFEQKAFSYFPVPFRSRNANCAAFHCTIQEGPRYCFGETTLPEGFAADHLSIPAPGEIFRSHLISRIREELVRTFQQEGKLLKKLAILQDVGEKRHVVDLRIDAQVYPTLLISSIEFAGNERFSDSFYRRELQIEEKSIFHPLELEQSLNRLARTGTLSSVAARDVELSVDEKTLEVDVLINLNERDRYGILYSFGPGRYGGLDASLAYSVLNLIGLGESLGIDVSAGDRTTGIALQLASRYLPGTGFPVSMALGLFSQHTGLRLPGMDDRIFSLFGIRETGISGQFNYRIKSKRDVGVFTKFARVESEKRHLLFTPYLRSVEDFGISQRISFFRGPENSWNLRPAFDWTQSAGQTLRFRMAGSHAFFFGNRAPVSERLFLGPSHVRGFPLSGPIGILNEQPAKIGGDTLIAFNTEYQIPVKEPVSLVPFFDIGLSTILTGNDKNTILQNTNQLARCSTGSEVRVQVPRIPQFRLVFSWNPLRFDSGARLHSFREPAFNFRVSLARW